MVSDFDCLVRGHVFDSHTGQIIVCLAGPFILYQDKNFNISRDAFYTKNNNNIYKKVFF